MNFRKMFLKYQQQANGEGDGGSGGAPTTYTQEQVDELVSKAVSEQVAGLKAKNGEVIGDNKKLKEQLAQFDGIDPNAVRAMLQRFASDEEAKLIADGKIDVVLEKRTEMLKTEHQKQLQTKDDALQQANSRIEKLSQLAVNGALVAAAGSVGALPESMKAIQALAKGVFVTDENGAVVALDSDGDVVYGKDGKTPLSVNEWLEGIKAEMPNLFSQPKGAGAKGSIIGSGSLKRSEMTSEQKHEFIKQYGQQAFLNLPK